MQRTIKILSEESLNNGWAKLNKVTYQAEDENGSKTISVREVYNRGNGAVILLYNKEQGTVVLTQQVRIPTYFNGNPDALLIEACAGMLDDNEPEEAIRRETEEETGYTLGPVTKTMEVFMSPGAVTETIHFFTAPYTSEMKTGEGGGLAEEHEDIQVIELPFTKALQMIKTGEIRDAKTIMLLQYAQIEKLLG